MYSKRESQTASGTKNGFNDPIQTISRAMTELYAQIIKRS